jgi:serine/threonine protein kinase/Tfp pilus assembly protein PilF
MTPSASGALRTESRERALGVLVDEVTAKLQAGVLVDIDAYAHEHPEHAESLRRLFPALQVLADLGRSTSRNHGAASADGLSPDEPLGTLGDFRLIREIGRGGMGVVYEAEQISLSRRVALKVLPFAAALDGKQLQRFKNEAQAAAHLHHTNIVPVHAVGCERGVHYYAMQYIEAQTLAELIRQLRDDARNKLPAPDAASKESSNDYPAHSTEVLAGLSTDRPPKGRQWFRTLARLGKQAAEALEHAHSLGVVHRDVKPANLLVDVRGNLWITNFGLAQCRGQIDLTLTGVRVGTARYMSPEQASGQRALVDHRTDIYSLGITLYELLTLESAYYGHDWLEVIRQITTQEPRRPRGWNAAIPVDLETIVLKALTKEPAGRYASAQELAEDLQRFLEDKPILARRPTRREIAAKWARRHKAVVRTGAVLLLLMLIGLAISASLIWKEKSRAETNARLAWEAADHMYTQVADKWLADQPQLTELQIEFLQNALEFYERFARENGDNLKVRVQTALAYTRVGHIQQKLGESRKGEEAFRRALVLWSRLAKEFPDQPVHRQYLARTRSSLGLLLKHLNRHIEAEEVYKEALRLQQSLVDEFPSIAGYRRELVDTYQAIGVVHKNAGQLQAADEAYHQARRLLAELADDTTESLRNRWQLATLHMNFGGLFRMTGQLQQAEKELEQGVLLLRQLVNDDAQAARYRLDLGRAYYNLGLCLKDTGRHPEAEKTFAKALPLHRRLADDFPKVPFFRRELAASYCGQGKAQFATGRLDEAERSFQQAQSLYQGLIKDFPTLPGHRADLGLCLNDLGNLRREAGRLEQAKHAFRAALALQRQLTEEYPTVPAYRQDLSIIHNNLGLLFGDLGQFPSAIEAYQRAIQLRARLAADHPTVPNYRAELAGTHNNLGYLLQVMQREAEAGEAYSQSLVLRKELVKEFPDRPEYIRGLVLVYISLGSHLSNVGRPEEAESTYRKAISLQEDLVERFPRIPRYGQALADALHNCAVLLRDQGQLAEASELFEQAVSQQWAALEADPKIPSYRRHLCRHYWDWALVHEKLEQYERVAQCGRSLAELLPTDWEHCARAGVLLTLCAALVAKDPRLDEDERPPRVQSYLAEANSVFHQAGELAGTNPKHLSAVAWFQSICPTQPYWSMTPALHWADQAVKLAPHDPTCWTTLGLACYRMHEYQPALAALEQAEQLGQDRNETDCLVLALVYWRLGEKEQARRWYDRAFRMRSAQESEPELHRLREEAAAVFDLVEPAVEVAKEVSSEDQR